MPLEGDLVLASIFGDNNTLAKHLSRIGFSGSKYNGDHWPGVIIADLIGDVNRGLFTSRSPRIRRGDWTAAVIVLSGDGLIILELKKLVKND